MVMEDTEDAEDSEGRQTEIVVLGDAKDGCASEVESSKPDTVMQGKRKKKRKTTIKGKGASDTKPPTPCGICNGNVNKVKSVYCEGCNRYIHLNRCTDEKTEEKMSLNLNFRCKNCTKGEVQTNDENEEANALINDQTITNKRNNKRKTT